MILGKSGGVKSCVKFHAFCNSVWTPLIALVKVLYCHLSLNFVFLGNICSFLRRIQNLEMSFVNDPGQEIVTDREEDEDDEGEDGLDVGPGGEAEHTEGEELAKLTESEQVDVGLRDLLDVVTGRIGGLLGHKEGHSLGHLVAVQGGHCHVQEETVQYSFRYERKDIGQEEHAQS